MKGAVINLLLIVPYFTVFGFYRSVVCILWILKLLIFRLQDTIRGNQGQYSLQLFRVKYNFITVLILPIYFLHLNETV
jgi:hypothetical protein